MKANKTKPKKKGVWKDDYYVRAYTLARQGMPDRRIAGAIGVTSGTFKRWVEEHPALRRALKQARGEKARNFQASFREYVYRALTPELQEVWDDINACENEPSGIARIEALLADRGKRARQHLFLYALVDSNFNASEACRKISISRGTLDSWIASDPDFGRIIDEMHWHKGNLFEQSLIDLVKDGDTKAVIFANRTYNRGRGYNEKLEVEHSGVVNHVHTIEIDSLNLPLEVKTAVLQAVRNKRDPDQQGQLALPAPEDVEDAEFQEVY